MTYGIAEAVRGVGTAPFFAGLAAPVGSVRLKADTTDEGPDINIGSVRLQPDRGIGSNAWVVSGHRSSTGSPLLAVDPHRRLANPPLRYLVHLSAPGWNVIGATAPWLPGVVIGHNERVAWGITSFAADA